MKGRAVVLVWAGCAVLAGNATAQSREFSQLQLELEDLKRSVGVDISILSTRANTLELEIGNAKRDLESKISLASLEQGSGRRSARSESGALMEAVADAMRGVDDQRIKIGELRSDLDRTTWALVSLQLDVESERKKSGSFGISFGELLVIAWLWGVPVVAGITGAHSRGRRAWLWGLICFAAGPVGLLALAAQADRLTPRA